MSRLSAEFDCESAFQSRPRTCSSSRFADRVVAIETKDFAGGVVQIGDSAAGIGDDDSFLDGIENRLEKTLLLREAKEIILHLLRPDPAETADQFFEEAWFHGV